MLIVKRDRFCQRTEDSWCKYQSDKLTGKETYKSKVNLPVEIKSAILPIFQDLSKDELLSKCLHGHTQNANEALNKLIWQRCPKSTFVSKKIVDLATASAVLYFNDGCNGLERIFQRFGIKNGVYKMKLDAKIDQCHVCNTNRKSTQKVK